MGKLIDADRLRDEILNDPDCDNDMINHFLAIVDEQPEIDAEPVRHGHWEEIRNDYGELEGWICECGHEVESADNYCSNCGAKMDAE